MVQLSFRLYRQDDVNSHQRELYTHAKKLDRTFGNYFKIIFTFRSGEATVALRKVIKIDIVTYGRVYFKLANTPV